MKTLDEVIHELEGKIACETHVGLRDALHYLKEFKRISARLEKIALGNITETLEKLDNPALSWEELQQMEGKPVWITPAEEWMLITEIVDGRIWLLGLDGLDYEMTLHDNWQAYRKEHS